MKLNRYKSHVLKTWLDGKRLEQEHWQHAAIGLTSEVGEFAGLVDKKIYKPSENVTRDMMLDELTDIMYYIHVWTYLLNTSIEELHELSTEKLKDGHGW